MGRILRHTHCGRYTSWRKGDAIVDTRRKPTTARQSREVAAEQIMYAPMYHIDHLHNIMDTV